MNKTIYNVASYIDMKYVEEAENYRTKPFYKTLFFKIGATCTSFFLIVISVIILMFPPTKDALTNDSDAEMAIIKPWNERSLYEQYTSALYKDIDYSCGKTAIDEGMLGECIGNGYAHGYDEYKDKSHQKAVDFFSINGINTECAIAVRFAHEDGYHVYCNTKYEPETLGQFKSDLSLEQNLTTGKIYSKGSNVVAESISAEVVLEILLSEDTIPMERNFDELNLTRIWGISTNVEILGYKNFTITITEEGYVWTNILGTGKAFYIGEEKVEAFIKHVTEGN